MFPNTIRKRHWWQLGNHRNHFQHEIMRRIRVMRKDEGIRMIAPVGLTGRRNHIHVYHVYHCTCDVHRYMVHCTMYLCTSQVSQGGGTISQWARNSSRQFPVLTFGLYHLLCTMCAICTMCTCVPLPSPLSVFNASSRSDTTRELWITSLWKLLKNGKILKF